jgi:hypothetical protein
MAAARPVGPDARPWRCWVLKVTRLDTSLRSNLVHGRFHPVGLCAGAADRYFGSFPKVGVVVPAAAAWVLPELQDMARTLTTTLDLPFELVHGISAEPTSDGFLIYLPSSAAPAAAHGRPRWLTECKTHSDSVLDLACSPSGLDAALPVPVLLTIG